MPEDPSRKDVPAEKSSTVKTDPPASAGGSDTRDQTTGDTEGRAAGATEKIPTRLGGCRIVREIGRGGMGTVYEAVQESLGRRVALKVLPATLAVDPEFVKRFEREAGTLAKLSHPGIVAIYDRGSEGGCTFFVMEYVVGARGQPENLTQILERGRLSQAQVLSYAKQILDALSHAHAEKIIHRDLKPANILIDRLGRTKIVDFGIAGIVDIRADDTHKLTMAGISLGTPAYMPPEQRLDARHSDSRSDVYAFGVMLFQMLTGIVPSGVFEPPSQVAAGIDPLWNPIVERCVKMAPDRRYADAGEVLSAMRALEHRILPYSPEAHTVVTERVGAAEDLPDDTGETATDPKDESHFAEERTIVTPLPKRSTKRGSTRETTAVTRSRADAETKYRAKDLFGAREAVRRGLAAAPDNPDLQNLLEKIESDLLEFASLSRRAEECLRSGNFTLASELARDSFGIVAKDQIAKGGEALVSDPRTVIEDVRACETALSAADDLLRAGDASAASEQISFIRERAPDSPRLKNLTARLHVLQKRKRTRRMFVTGGALVLTGAAAIFAFQIFTGKDGEEENGGRGSGGGNRAVLVTDPGSVKNEGGQASVGGATSAESPSTGNSEASEIPGDDPNALKDIQPLLTAFCPDCETREAAIGKLRSYLDAHPRSSQAPVIEARIKTLEKEVKELLEEASAFELVKPSMTGEPASVGEVERQLATLRAFRKDWPGSSRKDDVEARIKALAARKETLLGAESAAFEALKPLLSGELPSHPDQIEDAIAKLGGFVRDYPASDEADEVSRRKTALEAHRRGLQDVENRDYGKVEGFLTGDLPGDIPALDDAIKALAAFTAAWPHSARAGEVKSRIGILETRKSAFQAEEDLAYGKIEPHLRPDAPIPADRGEAERIISSLDQFLKSWPKSPRARSVSEELAKLEASVRGSKIAEDAHFERIGRHLSGDPPADPVDLETAIDDLKGFNTSWPRSERSRTVAERIAAFEDRRSQRKAAEAAAWSAIESAMIADVETVNAIDGALRALKRFDEDWPRSEHGADVRARILGLERKLKALKAEEEAAFDAVRPFLSGDPTDAAVIDSQVKALKRFAEKWPASEQAQAVKDRVAALEGRLASQRLSEDKDYAKIQPLLTGEPPDTATIERHVSELEAFRNQWPASTRLSEVDARISTLRGRVKTPDLKKTPTLPDPARRTVVRGETRKEFDRIYQYLRPFMDDFDAIEYGKIQIETISPDADTTRGQNWTNPPPAEARKEAGTGRILWSKNQEPAFEVTGGGSPDSAAQSQIAEMGRLAASMVTRCVPWADPKELSIGKDQWKVDWNDYKGSAGTEALRIVLAKKDSRSPQRVKDLPELVEHDTSSGKFIYREIEYRELSRNHWAIAGCTIEDPKGNFWRLQVVMPKGKKTTSGQFIRVPVQFGIRRFTRVANETWDEASTRHFHEGVLLSADLESITIR